MSAKRGKSKGKGRGASHPSLRRFARKSGAIMLVAAIALGSLGTWFVHHPRTWLETKRENWPAFVFNPIYDLGNVVGDLTDALGLTGHDTVYEYDTAAPEGQVLFAGAPIRTGLPAPDDIRVLDRGEFLIGWSDKLHHPAWCAYHVTPRALHDLGERPRFQLDRQVPAAPTPRAYEKSGYDRGHMVPNFAIKTRYGENAQKRTFLTSNIAPQSPYLNRGVWRDFEHRIAELWTARYGEIWVIVGAISKSCGETLSGTNIDVPEKFYQLVIAQEGMDVRALAVVIEQDVPMGGFPTRYLVSVDELERLTGLDFLPDLPEFIQSPLEAETPTRLWPIRFSDIFRQLAIRLG